MTRSNRHFQISLALFLLLCAVALDSLLPNIRAESTTSPGLSSETLTTNDNRFQSEESLSRSIRDAVEAIRPSLVTISGESRGRFSLKLPPLLPELSDGSYSPFDESSFPQSLFRSGTDQANGGTGLIVSEDGLIWTNTDVVRDRDSVEVRIRKDETYQGKVIFRDSETRLAVVKIEADKLPAAHFGSTSGPNLADWAVAIALDESQEPILSAGLISSVNWRESGHEAGVRFIRCGFPLSTDFAGCAFVNLKGELIGISVSSPAEFEHASSSCIALDSQSAMELQRKRQEVTTITAHRFDHPTSTVDDSDTFQGLAPNRKEESRSKLDNIRELFSSPRPDWTSASIASSVRSWLAWWQDAIDSQFHAISNASESR